MYPGEGTLADVLSVSQEAVAGCEAVFRNHVPEQRVIVQPQFHLALHADQVRVTLVGVDTLLEAEVAQLVAILPVVVVCHDSPCQLGHSGRLANLQVTQSDIGISSGISASDDNRGERSLCDFVGCSHCRLQGSFLSGEVHRSSLQVHRHEHVVVAQVRCLVLEAIFQGSV